MSLGNIRLGNLVLPLQEKSSAICLTFRQTPLQLPSWVQQRQNARMSGVKARSARGERGPALKVYFQGQGERRELTVTIVSSSSSSSSSEGENEVVGKPVETRDEEEEKTEVVCISSSLWNW